MPKPKRKESPILPGQVFALLSSSAPLYEGIDDEVSWKVRMDILNARLTKLVGAIDRRSYRGLLLCRGEALLSRAMAEGDLSTALGTLQFLAKLANCYTP